MSRIRLTGAAFVVALVAAASIPMPASPTGQPFAFLQPAIHLNADDHSRLNAGKPVVKVLPGRGRELAVVAAVRTRAPAERLMAWMQRLPTMQQPRYVPVVERFSSPPQIEDLERLTLDDRDLDNIRDCQPGDCGLKLSGAEIARLQQYIDGRSTWKRDVEAEFRRTVLTRAKDYLAAGDLGLLPYDDDSTPVSADIEAAALMDRLGLMSPRLPGVAQYLQRYPHVDHPDVVDSFLYWSRETLGFKPITSITHLTLLRGAATGMPGALAISKQVYANHYKDGAVALMGITGSDATQYLVYAHRSHVDVLDGVFGGLVRRIIERRVHDEAPAVLNALRVRLESGDPPPRDETGRDSGGRPD